MDLFLFDKDQLAAMARERAEQYRTAPSFPHIVIDDFLPAWVLDRIIAEFPGPDDVEWRRYAAEREVKLASKDPTLIPPFTQSVLAQLNSKAIIDFLEVLTGVGGLIPDPHLWGGGLHQIQAGGHLKIHSDFNWHEQLLLDRRLNLLLYLNKGWQPEWGGALELWDRDMSHCVERIEPIANRCVVFNTTDYSFHGHPDPLTCPPDRSRRSLALYYYTNGRPSSEVAPSRTTAFQPRPGETWRRSSGRGGRAADIGRRLLPPIVVDGIRTLKARARSGTS